MKNKTDPSNRLYAPLEPVFDRFRPPFEEFVHRTTTGGLLLMMTALLALILANHVLATQYQEALHIPIGFHLGGWQLEHSLHHWINDGLMTLFFFTVGLELKRELLVGELADTKQAMLPIIAALGGMVTPALIYFSLNPTGDASAGWGIPMATDIAFALGVIALLAGRVPKSLIAFLVALAIVDDLGAVLIIALFYTEQLNLQLLFIAALITGLLLLMNRSGMREPLPYFLVGTLLWFVLLESGVHATLAGVITAFTIPALPRYNSQTLTQRIQQHLTQFDAANTQHHSNLLHNQQQFAILNHLSHEIKHTAPPLQTLEHQLHFPVAFLVLPIFALANAGIPINISELPDQLTQPVTLGVMAGLLFGKLLGIAGFSWLAVKLRLAQLPAEVSFRQIIGVSMLGGIGFTMSIFIAEIGFAGQETLILQAKMGILVASVVAGFLGYWFLKQMSIPLEKTA